jgi:hypothetical protein
MLHRPRICLVGLWRTDRRLRVVLHKRVCPILRSELFASPINKTLDRWFGPAYADYRLATEARFLESVVPISVHRKRTSRRTGPSIPGFQAFQYRSKPNPYLNSTRNYSAPPPFESTSIESSEWWSFPASVPCPVLLLARESSSSAIYWSIGCAIRKGEKRCPSATNPIARPQNSSLPKSRCGSERPPVFLGARPQTVYL